jgi:hypothetical protein
MLTVIRRPMAPHERERVEQHLQQIRAAPQGCLTYFILLVGGATLGMLASVVLILPLLLLERFVPIPVPLRIACQAFVLATSAIGFLWGLRILVKEKQDQAGPCRQDLIEGMVDVIHCTVTDAAVVLPYEDEGTSFFLQVDDARLLVLPSYYFPDETVDPESDLESDLDELAEENWVPNRELHIVLTPNARLILEFERLGETFSPSRVVEPMGWMEDGGIITGTVATLEDDLRRYWDEKEAAKR